MPKQVLHNYVIRNKIRWWFLFFGLVFFFFLIPGIKRNWKQFPYSTSRSIKRKYPACSIRLQREVFNTLSRSNKIYYCVSIYVEVHLCTTQMKDTKCTCGREQWMAHFIALHESLFSSLNFTADSTVLFLFHFFNLILGKSPN